MAEKHNYHFSEWAEDNCLEASSEFLETLKLHNFEIVDPEFGGVKRILNRDTAALREYIFEPRNKDEAIRQKYDDYVETFPFKTDGMCFHFVVKVGEFIVDWTARQFEQYNPFPAIWREL